MEKKRIMVTAKYVKQYLKENHGLSTSKKFIELLSDKIIPVLDISALNAKEDGRKTILERDLK